MEDQFALLLTNQLGHVQASLDSLNDSQRDVITELRELRSDIREIKR
jgi:hypothetical protein